MPLNNLAYMGVELLLRFFNRVEGNGRHGLLFYGWSILRERILRGIVKDVKVRIAGDINGAVSDYGRGVNRRAEIAFADDFLFLGSSQHGEIAVFVTDINLAVGDHC